MNGIIFAFSLDRKSTRLNSSHGYISYAVFCLKKLTLAELPEMGFDAILVTVVYNGTEYTFPLRENARCQDGHFVTAKDVIYFFFNDTAPTEISALSLHDALPI